MLPSKKVSKQFKMQNGTLDVQVHLEGQLCPKIRVIQLRIHFLKNVFIKHVYFIK